MKRWPLKKIYFWESAPFFRILVPLVAGILCYDLYKGGSLPIIIAVIICSGILYALTALRNNTSRFISLAGFFLMQLIIVLIAWVLCFLNDVRNNPAWFGNHLQADGFAMRITDIPKEKAKTYKLRVSVLDALEHNDVIKATGDAFIYVYKKGGLPFKKGDTVLVPARWQPIKNIGSASGFDYVRYCEHNNLFYTQILPANKMALYKEGSGEDLSLAEQCHNWCMQQLNTYLQDSSARGLIEAMLLGDEVNIDNHLMQAYSETGIVHIIAISGGNVAIFFIVISTLLWWLKHKKYAWLKYLIALPLVWFYVFMAGAPPSAIRAAMMFSLLAIGFMIQRSNNSLNQLFATAFILLCAQPMWLFSVGFQLSFVAVLSLIIFYKPIYSVYKPKNKILKALWGTIVASMAAELLVAPIVIYYFHLFPLFFIVANVIAYAFMSFVLILAMGIIALSPVPPIAYFLGMVTEWLVTTFNKIVYWLQQLNPVSFHSLILKNYELGLVYIIIGGIALFIMRKKKNGLFIGLSAACLLLLSFCNNEWHSLHQTIPDYTVSQKNHT